MATSIRGILTTAVLMTLLLTSSAKKKKHKTNHYPVQYYMMNFCGVTFNMAERRMSEVIFGLTSHGRYGSNINCTMDIVTSPGHQLSFKLVSVTLHNCDDYITLYGNTTNSSDALTPKMCSKARDSYTTPDSKGSIRLETSHNDHDGGFTILVTSFYTPSDGGCRRNYFGCGSGICIPKGLACNNRDNCGDNSDEHEKCDENENWWVPIPCVAGGICALMLFCHFKKKRDAKIAMQKAEQEKKKKAEEEAKKKKAAGEKKKKDNEEKKAEEEAHEKEEEQKKAETQTPPEISMSDQSTQTASKEKEHLESAQNTGLVWTSSVPHSVTPLEPMYAPFTTAPPAYTEVPLTILPTQPASYLDPSTNSAVVWVTPCSQHDPHDPTSCRENSDSTEVHVKVCLKRP